MSLKSHISYVYIYTYVEIRTTSNNRHSAVIWAWTLGICQPDMLLYIIYSNSCNDWLWPRFLRLVLSLSCFANTLCWRCNSVELASGGISYFHAIPHGTCVFYIDDYWFILHSWLIIIDDHWLSMIIIEDHWWSSIISDNHWLSLTFMDYHWRSWIVIDVHRCSLMFNDYHWLSLIVIDYHCFFNTVIHWSSSYDTYIYDTLIWSYMDNQWITYHHWLSYIIHGQFLWHLPSGKLT